jgi:Domain of unknown function (DUF4062)
MAPKLLTKLRVFAASPNDVAGDREALRDVVDDLNESVAGDRGFVLELVTWVDVAPDLGRPEQIILEQIGEFDIFIGLMGRRFGTATGKYEAGTEEEFYTAYERWQEFETPRVLFYFNEEKAPLPSSQEEVAQLSKVLSFRGNLEKLGLVKGYQNKRDLLKQVRRDLTTVLRQKGNVEVATEKPRKAASSADYWETWRDASLESRLAGERVEATIYRSARASVDFLTISGRSIYSGIVEEILSQKPATFSIRLLLFDWNSPEVPEKMRAERRENEVMIDMARHTANSIARQFLLLAEGLNLSLKIKLYREYPVWRLLIADKKVAYLGYYPNGKRGYEGPMFVLNSSDSSSLFAPVSHYFDVLWKKSGKLLTRDDERFRLLPLAELETLESEESD